MGIEVLAVASLASSAIGIKKQRDASKAQERAARAEQRRAEIQNIQQTRRQIREARVQAGSLVNQAALSGGIGGSGLAGGLSSVGAQLGGQLNYMSQIAQQNQTIFDEQVSAARSSSQAQTFGALGQMGLGIFKDFYNPSPSVQPASGAPSTFPQVGQEKPGF